MFDLEAVSALNLLVMNLIFHIVSTKISSFA